MPIQDVQRPGITGEQLVFNDAAVDDQFVNDGRVMLVITNGDSGSQSCTLDDPNTPIPPGSTANYDALLTVPAGQTKVFGPFPRSRFNDGDQLVTMTWSAIPDDGGDPPVITLTWALLGLK